MKTNLFAAILLASVLGWAQTEDHSAHHPEAQTQQKGKAADMQKGRESMMGKMDMERMHEMMGECEKMHKDGKMCDHEMMEKCEKQMSKGECAKMMKEAKADTKTDKVKK